jgi:hypothetical protein
MDLPGHYWTITVGASRRWLASAPSPQSPVLPTKRPGRSRGVPCLG